ncbi:MAG: hypothetical protein A2075_08735 [Geobacteraceae bacterium GWC2_58_44]|nr:MAG: hypothetical protein A2075_08735 [Geobacteraceae bacterium GWC2_58_44]HBG06080.1 hypothetical protein [Geobacter sp.]
MRDASDRDSRMAGVVADMTEQKKPSEEANGIRKTESVGVAASGLAHDFPLCQDSCRLGGAV